ncbi:MAG: glycoside hydrolase family 43 protein [Gemmatirosa sp.]
MPATFRHRSIPPFAALLVAAGCSSGATAPTRTPPVTTPPVTTTCTFTNPVLAGADPSLVQKDGNYYFVQSSNNGIFVYRSQELTRPAQNAVQVWTAPDTGWNRTNVWAPELQYQDGRWYIYYAAGRAGPPFIHQRSGVLESVGDDPQGRYVDRGMLYTGDSVATRGSPQWAIDLTVHRMGGQLYAVWSGWERDAVTDRTPQHLYIARMANPTTIATNRVRISSPSASWEQRSAPDGLELQEGPEFLERDGQRFIVYSTGESWLPAYKLGMLRMTSADADPMNPASYVKTGPVFQSANGVFGVGHHTFTKSPDGREDWLVYHAKTSTTPGWDDRRIRMQPFTWAADGTPVFGTPVASSTALPRPSGECR